MSASNSSGQYLAPPQPQANQDPYAYGLLYGLWLRTGGQIAPSNAGGVGIGALLADINAVSVVAEDALELAAAGLLFSDEVPDVDSGSGPSTSDDSAAALALMEGGEPVGLDFRQVATVGFFL